MRILTKKTQREDLEVSSMATSSITNTVRIEGENAVKRFVVALDKAKEKATTREHVSVSYRRVRGKDIADLFRKSK